MRRRDIRRRRVSSTIDMVRYENDGSNNQKKTNSVTLYWSFCQHCCGPALSAAQPQQGEAEKYIFGSGDVEAQVPPMRRETAWKSRGYTGCEQSITAHQWAAWKWGGKLLHRDCPETAFFWGWGSDADGLSSDFIIVFVLFLRGLREFEQDDMGGPKKYWPPGNVLH